MVTVSKMFLKAKTKVLRPNETGNLEQTIMQIMALGKH